MEKSKKRPSQLMLEALRLAAINPIYGYVVADGGTVRFASKSAVRAALLHRWIEQTGIVAHHYTRTPVYSITEAGRKVLEQEGNQNECSE